MMSEKPSLWVDEYVAHFFQGMACSLASGLLGRLEGVKSRLQPWMCMAVVHVGWESQRWLHAVMVEVTKRTPRRARLVTAIKAALMEP